MGYHRRSLLPDRHGDHLGRPDASEVTCGLDRAVTGHAEMMELLGQGKLTREQASKPSVQFLTDGQIAPFQRRGILGKKTRPCALLAHFARILPAGS